MDAFKLQDIAEALGVITVKLHGKKERVILIDSTGFLRGSSFLTSLVGDYRMTPLQKEIG